MDKELFVEIINFIIAQEEREFKLTSALKEYGGEMSDFMSFGTDLNTRIVGWLEKIMQDSPTDPTISWWLWDAPDRGRGKKKWRTITSTDSKKKYDLKTPGDLYDYLVENPYED